MMQIDIQKTLSGAEGKLLVDISMSFSKGSIIGIYGPSGAGKSSFLKMLSGLMIPDKGLIRFNEQLWFKDGKNSVAPKDRNIAFVFQDYALFPHMTVRENLQFSKSDQVTNDELNELMSSVELINLADQVVTKLSGGQQQRVAFARAFAQRANIILMDEPLSALGYKMRKGLQQLLKTYHAKYQPTIVLVSHDIDEILSLVDQLYILRSGHIVEKGSPIEVFSRLSNELTATEKLRVVDKKMVDGKLVLKIMVNGVIQELIIDGTQEAG